MELLAAGLPEIFHAFRDFFSASNIQSLIEAGGYFVLFGLLFACGLGLPLPEDIPLIIAGILIAQGQFHLVPVAIAAWCGIMGGDLVLYHFGKKFGLEITRVRFIGKHLTKQRIERMEQMFDRYGIFVVAVGRLIAGVRGAMVVAAGAVRYNFWKFIITDGIMALVSGGAFVWLGHWLGNFDAHKIKEFKHILILVVIALFAALLAWYLLQRRLILNRKKAAPDAPPPKLVDAVVGKVVDKLAPHGEHALRPAAKPRHEMPGQP
jgi:membrane protein DedA with SNARE-associated domain